MEAPRTIQALLIPSEWIPPIEEESESSEENNPESIAVASEAARDLVLQLSLASTRLCKELNEQIGQHPDFEEWKKNRKIPRETLIEIWDSLRATSSYQGMPYETMPERFLRSAWLRVESIYASWFKIQAKLLSRLHGLKRWLSIVKSDNKLAEICGCSIEQIQTRAGQLLAEARVRLKEKREAEKAEGKEKKQPKKGKKRSKAIEETASTNESDNQSNKDPEVETEHTLTDELFDTYFELVESRGSLLDQCAIVHLIKNGCKIASEPENIKEFAKKCQGKRTQIERTEKQLSDRIPRVRDLGEEAERAFSNGIERVPLDNAEFAAQLTDFQKKPNPLPYAVLFYSGDDVEWHLLKRRNLATHVLEERIFVKFKGLQKYLKRRIREELEKHIEEHLIELGLKLDDIRWRILKRRNKTTQKLEYYISFGLKQPNTCLRKQLSERFEKIDLKNKYNPQKEYVFEVCCGQRQLQDFQIFLQDWKTYSDNIDEYSIDAFAFDAAALVWKQSVENDISTFQIYLKCTLDHKQLTAEGAEFIRNKEISKLTKKIADFEEYANRGESLTDKQQTDLKKARSQLTALDNPYSRSSKPPYQGNPNIIVGVCFSQKEVATVAVVDCSTQKVLAYRNDRQLLRDDYKHLAAYRLEQRKNANERHKQQKRGKVSTLSESKKGEHLDRVIAKRIVEVAQEFKAGSLAMPDLTDIRESLQAELEAKAVGKYPGDRAKQKEYEKQYKINLHRWPYGRLIKSIEQRAAKIGIPIEEGQQPDEGDLQEKAVQIVWSAHHARKGRKDTGT
jgi:IS605 OrfB family transposase